MWAAVAAFLRLRVPGKGPALPPSRGGGSPGGGGGGESPTGIQRRYVPSQGGPGAAAAKGLGAQCQLAAR